KGAGHFVEPQILSGRGDQSRGRPAALESHRVDGQDSGVTPRPVLAAESLASILRRERLPVMQNVSYPTRELALASVCAPFELSGCESRWFMFNGRSGGGFVRHAARHGH